MALSGWIDCWVPARGRLRDRLGEAFKEGKARAEGIPALEVGVGSRLTRLPRSCACEPLEGVRLLEFDAGGDVAVILIDTVGHRNRSSSIVGQTLYAFSARHLG